MSFTIYGEHPGDNRSAFVRNTAAGAVFKVADLASSGMLDVHIIDTRTGRTFRHDEFHLLIGGKVDAQRPRTVALALTDRLWSIEWAHLEIKGELRHAEYIATWIDLLKDDNRAIFTASSKASQAAEYLRSFSETVADPA
jgi:hypothetical protein